jgi:pimeloyl-ACP methyl ester carboxylesterase
MDIGIGGAIAVLIIGLVLPIPASYLVEALRSAPAAPERLAWAPDVPVRYVEVNGVRLRYVTAGEGRPLVLLHTLRTQLDMFQKMIPELARHFRVYALDHPGHGYSDIPDVDYRPEFFVSSVAGFLERLDIKDAVIAGESIGGSIALLLAARQNPRVQRVIAINPYDYDRGRGLRRSSALANLLFGLNDVPVLGATVTRLRQFPIVKKVFEGGVHHSESFPPTLLREMYAVGNRPGHYQAFMSLVSHWPEWEEARKEYGAITVPTLLVYGDHDWSRPHEREANLNAIPGATMETVENGGHFLSVDRPEELVAAIRRFAGGAAEPRAKTA